MTKKPASNSYDTMAMRVMFLNPCAPKRPRHCPSLDAGDTNRYTWERPRLSCLQDRAKIKLITSLAKRKFIHPIRLPLPISTLPAAWPQQELRRTKSCWTAVGLLSSRCFFRSRRARPPLPPVCHMLSISAAAESLFTVLCNLMHLCGSQHGWPALRCRLFHTIRSAVGTVGTVGCEWVPVLLLGAQLVASGGIRRPLRIAAPFCPVGSSFPIFLHRIHGRHNRASS